MLAELDDTVLEEIFGAPHVAAADLHELRAWGHGKLSLLPTAGSQAARELCVATDPSWPSRGLTNEKISAKPEARPRGSGLKVLVAESTVETMMTVADGRNPPSTKKASRHDHETLWPAQNFSWRTWVMTSLDISGGRGGPDMRAHGEHLDLPFIPAAEFFMAVRRGGSTYLDAVADRLSVVPRSLLKMGCTVLHQPDYWLQGLAGFNGEWLAQYPDGELALWLRSAVANGWMTSHQIAAYMGLPSARSCRESWITA